MDNLFWGFLGYPPILGKLHVPEKKGKWREDVSENDYPPNSYSGWRHPTWWLTITRLAVSTSYEKWWNNNPTGEKFNGLRWRIGLKKSLYHQVERSPVDDAFIQFQDYTKSRKSKTVQQSTYIQSIAKGNVNSFWNAPVRNCTVASLENQNKNEDGTIDDNDDDNKNDDDDNNDDDDYDDECYHCDDWWMMRDEGWMMNDEL